MLNPLDSLVLTKALHAFNTATGLDFAQSEKPPAKSDAVIEIQGELVMATIKRNIRPAHLGSIIQQVQSLGGHGLLLADYINPRIAEALREAKISYLDTCGNAFINQPSIYVFITGQKPVAESPRETNKAFEANGLKLVFGLLCNHRLINSTYREMAKYAGIALGSVGSILGGLAQAGYLIDLGSPDKRQLLNHRKLLDRWVEAYPEKLRPKLFVGKFFSEDLNWWQKINVSEFDARWGGEVGAAKHTSHLRPYQLTLYLPETSGGSLLAAARLRKAFQKDDFGLRAVIIYRPFWTSRLEELLHRTDTVHPILIYADLIASADSRNLETARQVYEIIVAEHIHSD